MFERRFKNHLQMASLFILCLWLNHVLNIYHESYLETTILQKIQIMFHHYCFRIAQTPNFPEQRNSLSARTLLYHELPPFTTIHFLWGNVLPLPAPIPAQPWRSDESCVDLHGDWPSPLCRRELAGGMWKQAMKHLFEWCFNVHTYMYMYVCSSDPVTDDQFFCKTIALQYTSNYKVWQCRR